MLAGSHCNNACPMCAVCATSCFTHDAAPVCVLCGPCRRDTRHVHRDEVLRHSAALSNTRVQPMMRDAAGALPSTTLHPPVNSGSNAWVDSQPA